MIRVMCPHCQRTYRTRTEGMGRTAVCTGCHRTFTIGSARPLFQWKPTDLGEDSWIGVEVPEEKREIRHCVMCEAMLEDDAVRCPACGANQVTGLVTKVRRKPPADVKIGWWSRLPWRGIVITSVLAVVAAGVVLGVRAFTRGAAGLGEQMADQAVVQQVIAELARGESEAAIRLRHAGQVDDDDLPRFLRMLSTGKPEVRKAVRLLIACGEVTQLQPILDLAPDGATAGVAMEVLEAIGPRRLLELSRQEDVAARRSAVRALCMVLRMKGDAQVVETLAAARSPTEVIAALNGMTRRWPEATGVFSVVMNETESPFTVSVEQVGPAFALHVGPAEFWTSGEGGPAFDIPIDQWCAATAGTTDSWEDRAAVSGAIRLISPVGVGWQGTATVVPRGRLTKALPGFLPVGPLPLEQQAEIRVLLRRPTRLGGSS